MNRKYQVLLQVLDSLRREAPIDKYAQKYHADGMGIEAQNQARSRSLIHLFLKVRFGILDFEERERYVTDGPYDEGIDGYYIDEIKRKIYIIQSKYRANSENFESKEIDKSELMVMDVDRVTGGEVCDAAGNEYNGKIKQLTRDIKGIVDIGRYNYIVVILANVVSISEDHLGRLVGGYKTEVMNFEKTYVDLVLPVVCGTYFSGEDLTIHLDLSNKTSGSETYSVSAKNLDCEITVLFVPTVEIARIMLKYKNSILKYNPRNYLDLAGSSVNDGIRSSIVDRSSNEFALLNNGITIISDDTNLNKKIGQKNMAQLHIRNPQVINGGQTAYTLSRIYESLDCAAREAAFGAKEVLVKIITLPQAGDDLEQIRLRLELIEEISEATNSQTAVSYADRASNDPVYIDIQKVLFERYGLFYERKRGEFSDGIAAGYVSGDDIIERNLFVRLYAAVSGNIPLATVKKIFAGKRLLSTVAKDFAKLDKWYFGYLVFRIVNRAKTNEDIRKYRDVLSIVWIASKTIPEGNFSLYPAAAIEAARVATEKWNEFASNAARRRYRAQFGDDVSAEFAIESERPKASSEDSIRKAFDLKTEDLSEYIESASYKRVRTKRNRRVSELPPSEEV